jgi:hypothetical protein
MRTSTLPSRFLVRVFVFLFVSLSPLVATPALWAGPIFLTGHDPDFHSQDSAGAANLLRSGLSFVTNGTFDDGSSTKFLWVESRIATPSGHRIGEAGLNALGLTLGVNYDRANAAELAGANFSGYTALAIASSFGGLLTRAELDGLIARSAAIASYVNAGGGLLALSECFPCGANLLTGATAPNLFGYLPVSVSSIPPVGSFTVTPEGAAPPFNLTNADVNDPTHNSFGLIGGLVPLDRDQGTNATTLAANVGIDQGGFVSPVPEPTTLLLFGSTLAGLGIWRKRHAKARPEPRG